MRIGIDAKWYFTGNISGRIVVTNLLQQLAKLSTKHQFIIILSEKDRNKSFPFSANSNFEIVYYKCYTNQLANVLSPLFLRRYRLDVCIYQYFSPFLSSYKRVVYIHDIIFETNPEYFSRKERLYFLAMKWMARRAHGIVTVSETEKKRLKDFGYIGKNSQIIAIHNGISDKFKRLSSPDEKMKQRVKERYGLPDWYILYLGRLNKRKNIPSLVKAFAKVQVQDLFLVIAGGSDWSKVDIGQLVADANLSEKVILTGFIKDEDIPIIYQLASAFCFLSFDEGFGLPVAEAMACGVPVIVSDTAINHEICGDAALYVDPNDITAISAAVHQALGNDENIQHKVEVGRQIARNYRWDLSADKLLRFIFQL